MKSQARYYVFATGSGLNVRKWSTDRKYESIVFALKEVFGRPTECRFVTARTKAEAHQLEIRSTVDGWRYVYQNSEDNKWHLCDSEPQQRKETP